MLKVSLLELILTAAAMTTAAEGKGCVSPLGHVQTLRRGEPAFRLDPQTLSSAGRSWISGRKFAVKRGGRKEGSGAAVPSVSQEPRPCCR